jgi:hypothetical protein
MRRTFLRSAASLFALGLISAAVNSARADTLYQTGFESPTYTVGALDSQDGWFNAATATVQNTTVFAGQQAATFSSAGLSAQDLAIHNVTNTITAPDQIITISGEFQVSATDGTVWDVAALANGSGGFLGQIIESNGSVRLGLASTSVGNIAIASGVWNSFDVTINTATETQAAFINGTFLGQGALANNTPFGRYSFGINSGFGHSDTLSIDDLSITASTPLPSSASMGMILLGGMAVVQLVRRRLAAMA